MGQRAGQCAERCVGGGRAQRCARCCTLHTVPAQLAFCIVCLPGCGVPMQTPPAQCIDHRASLDPRLGPRLLAMRCAAWLPGAGLHTCLPACLPACLSLRTSIPAGPQPLGSCLLELEVPEQPTSTADGHERRGRSGAVLARSLGAVLLGPSAAQPRLPGKAALLPVGSRCR